MNLYEPRQLADSMRVVRENTIAIAEDIPEVQYDYGPRRTAVLCARPFFTWLR
jgi:hypothetical protein